MTTSLQRLFRVQRHNVTPLWILAAIISPFLQAVSSQQEAAAQMQAVPSQQEAPAQLQAVPPQQAAPVHLPDCFKTMQQPPRIAVIGAGLAGLSAALQCLKAAESAAVPIQVLILEKWGNAGGNSFKASSGMNALTPENGDTNTIFEADTLQSGGGLSDEKLVQRLVGDSQGALAFLSQAGADLSRVTRLGGHSIPRTHSNPTGPNVGFAITNMLLGQVKKAANVDLLCDATVKEIKMDAGRVTGIEYTGPLSSFVGTSDGNSGVSEGDLRTIRADAVIIATGGFAANEEMLKEYCPEAAEYATTNGPWASGDGVKLALAAGAGLRHMDHVQLHPTGFVDLQAPDARTKWLAPERLRGCGALLLNREGKRFVDELQRRDVVTEHIITLPDHHALLLVGPEAAQQFGVGSLEFYASKGMMKKADGIAGVADAIGADAEVIRTTLNDYNTACASGVDEFGKRYFPCEVHVDNGTSYVATVTPVVHYCMGGVRVGPDAGVQTTSGQPLSGLYAAGEVTGGLHGANRLGGNSLLDCVVFGRAAGESAIEFVLTKAQTSRSLASSECGAQAKPWLPAAQHGVPTM